MAALGFERRARCGDLEHGVGADGDGAAVGVGGEDLERAHVGVEEGDGQDVARAYWGAVERGAERAEVTLTEVLAQRRELDARRR